MIDEQLIVQLSEMLNRLGPVSHDTSYLLSVLRIKLAGDDLRIRLLSYVIEGGMLPQIAALVHSRDANTAQELVGRLTSQYGLLPDQAQWSARVWFKAFQLSAAQAGDGSKPRLALEQPSIGTLGYLESIQALKDAEVEQSVEALMLRGKTIIGLLQLIPSVHYLIRMVHMPPRILPKVRSVLDNPMFNLSQAIEVYAYAVNYQPGAHAGVFRNACARSADDLYSAIMALSRTAVEFRREATDYSLQAFRLFRKLVSESEQIFSSLQSERPQNAEGHFYHGVALYLGWMLEHNVLGVSRSNTVQIDRTTFQSLVSPAFSNRDEKPQKRAIGYFNEALRLDPTLYEALYYRARLFDYFGAYTEARRDLERLLRQTPLHADAYALMGGLLRSLKEDPDRQLEAYSAAIGQNAYHARALTRRGRIYVETERFVEAVADLERATKLDPLSLTSEHPLGAGTGPTSRHMLADAYSANDQTEKAIEILSEVIDILPEDVLARESRAFCYQDEGELELALADFRVLLTLDGGTEEPWNYIYLGDCYYELGRMREAREAYEQFFEVDKEMELDTFKSVPEDTLARMQAVRVSQRR